MDNEELQEQQQVDQGQPSSRSLTQTAGSIKEGISNATATAAKATRGLSKAEKGAAVAAKAGAKAAKVGGKAMEAGGKAVETAGKGMQEAGKGIESASNSAGSALSAIPYVGGVLGGIVKGAGLVAGKSTEAAGKGTELAGKGMQKAGKGMQKGGDKLEQASKKLDAKSKAHKQAAKNIDDFSKKVDKGNFKGDKEKNAAKNAAGQAANQAKNKLVDALKGLINPGDPERLLKKKIRRIIIILIIIALCVLVIFIIVEDSQIDDENSLGNSSDYLIRCDGNIKLELLGELEPPVSLTEGQLITFDSESNFGYSGFYMHNGLDLTEKSTDTKTGDDVYSVYDGEVVESTYDDTYSDKKVKGGWVKIKYEITIENTKYNFAITYGGLSKSSLTLKTGDKVTKKQVIGKVGTAKESENGEEAGVHFGFYDNITQQTLNPVNLFIPCYKEENSDSLLKLHEIEISKEDFNKATRDYLNGLKSSSHCASMKNWDLDSVYDLSVKNNINPEFVVIRAVEEGCSPYYKLPSYNNYWGIGCYNNQKLSKCASYTSFENGIQGLANLKIVKTSNTLSELMSQYSYLGDFWLNPGNSGDGGCYFFSSIKKYMPAERVSLVETYCVTGRSCQKGGKGDCLATTEEDKKAYTKYLCERMDKMFESVYSKYHTQNTQNPENPEN